MKQGISQVEMANRCHIERSTVWRIEEKKFSPKLEIAEAMAEALGAKITISK